jgi:hypothetical protein
MEEQGMRVFVNRALKGPKRNEVTGGWGKLSVELHNLYSLPGIIRKIRSRKMRWGGVYNTHGKEINVRKARKISP